MITEGQYYWYNGYDFPQEKVLCVSDFSGNTDDCVVIRLTGDRWTVDKRYLERLDHEEASDMILPTDAQERKKIPIITGVLDYFPLAIAEIAKCSLNSNEQHNPGQELHWDRTKSTDHVDCIGRHLIDRGKFDTDGQRHTAKLAWRALAMLQIELENENMKGNG